MKLPAASRGEFNPRKRLISKIFDPAIAKKVSLLDNLAIKKHHTYSGIS